MKLYLMRHGEALSSQLDPENGLSDNGKLSINRVASHLKETGIEFQQIFHSKKKRARQTAEIMAQIISPETKPQLQQGICPNDDVSLIVNKISGWNENTLITSHLPFVPNLITALTGKDAFLSAISFETGTIVCLEKTGAAEWHIIWATSPSEL